MCAQPLSLSALLAMPGAMTCADQLAAGTSIACLCCANLLEPPQRCSLLSLQQIHDRDSPCVHGMAWHIEQELSGLQAVSLGPSPLGRHAGEGMYGGLRLCSPTAGRDSIPGSEDRACRLPTSSELPSALGLVGAGIHRDDCRAPHTVLCACMPLTVTAAGWGAAGDAASGMTQSNARQCTWAEAAAP